MERYEVELAYTLRGDAAPGLTGIGAAAERAEKSTFSLKSAILGLGTAIGASTLFSKGKEAFIDFNKEVESTKISIAAISNMFSGGSFASSVAQADGIFTAYQEAAKASTATTKDFLEMHKMVAPVLTQSGASMTSIMDTVKGATVAAPIFGVRPEMLAIDIRQMLQGAVGAKDLAANIMISSLGLDREEFNKKARENVNFAVETINRALTSPSIKDAARAFEGSFEGVTSTLADTMQILAGEAGQPLFKAITDEIKSWNEWLTQNQYVVETIKRDVQGALLDGFHAIKGFVRYLVENKDTFVVLGSLWASLKGVQVVGGAVGGLGDIAASFKKMGSETEATVTGLGKLAGQAASSAMALAGLYTAAQAFAEWVDAKHKRSLEGQGNIGALHGQIAIALGSKAGNKDIAAGAVASQLREAGVLNAAGVVDRDKFRAWAESQGAGAPEAIVLAVQAEKAMARGNQAHIDRIAVQFSRETSKKQAKQKKDPGVQVTISRVEVASDDPDRFVLGIVKLADRAASRAVQSPSAIPMR
jgi:hypothetical protein